MPEEPKQTPPVTTPAAEPPASRFQEMVAKLENEMGQWNEARYKQPQPPQETKETPKESPKESPKEAPKEAAKPSETPKAPVEPAAEKTPPVEANDDDEPVPAIIKSQKAADEFRNLRRTLKSQIKAKEAEIFGLKKKVEEVSHTQPVITQTPSIDVKEFERLKTEREQLVDQIERVSLEASPRFKAKFDKVTTEIEASAKDAAGEKAEEALSLLKMTPSKYRKEKLNEIVADLGPADQSALVIAFARMDQARAEKEDVLNNHREYIQQLQSEELAKQQEQQSLAQAKREYIIKQAMEVAKDFEAFQHKEDDPTHNAEADEYRSEVAAFINGQIDETHSAFLPILAAEGQYLKAKKIPALEAKIKELETVINEMKGSNPKLEGAKTKESDRETRKQKGFAEAFSEHWKGPNYLGT